MKCAPENLSGALLFASLKPERLPPHLPRLRHGRVARLQRLPRHLAVLALGEDVGVDTERDGGAGVAQLVRDERHVEPLC